MDQADKMFKMRVKVDVWSKRLHEDIRVEIRKQLHVIFCELPARRLWLYLKKVKRRVFIKNWTDNMVIPELDALSAMDAMDSAMDGEDTIVSGKFARAPKLAERPS